MALPPSGQPVRIIRSGHRGVRGFATVMGRQTAVESALESDFLAILDADPNLRGVTGQPVRIAFPGPAGRTRHYVPDFLATYGDDRPVQVIYEVKYRADLLANWTSLKPAFMAARRYARENGARFSIMTEVEIRGPYLANMRFLRAYRDRPYNGESEEHLVRTIAVLGETTPMAALAAAYWDHENRIAAIAPLWRLLAIGRIRADLSQRLTMATTIWVVTGKGHL